MHTKLAQITGNEKKQENIDTRTAEVADIKRMKQAMPQPSHVQRLIID